MALSFLPATPLGLSLQLLWTHLIPPDTSEAAPQRPQGWDLQGKGLGTQSGVIRHLLASLRESHIVHKTGLETKHGGLMLPGGSSYPPEETMQPCPVAHSADTTLMQAGN